MIKNRVIFPYIKLIFTSIIVFSAGLSCAINDSDPKSYDTPTSVTVNSIKPVAKYPIRKMMLTIDNHSNYFVSSIFQGCSNWARGSGWLLSGLSFKKMLPGEQRVISIDINLDKEYKCIAPDKPVINIYCQVDRTGLSLNQSSPWFAAQSVQILDTSTQKIIVTNDFCRAPRNAPIL